MWRETGEMLEEMWINCAMGTRLREGSGLVLVRGLRGLRVPKALQGGGPAEGEKGVVDEHAGGSDEAD